MKRNLASGLQTLRDVQAAALVNWFQTQEKHAGSLANDREIRTLATNLILPSEAEDTEGSPAAWDQQLQAQIEPVLSSYNYSGYVLADSAFRIVASSDATLVGQEDIPEYREMFVRAMDGETVVCPPFPSVVMTRTPSGALRVGEPTMFVAAPIRNDGFQAIGILALRIRPEREFTQILQRGRAWKSGETYAFDESGWMVSNSRFDEELILLGLLPDREDTRSLLNIQLRDPEGDMSRGYRPRVRRAQLPLTRMAADAVEGNPGVNVEGYRDYRGVPVVGAWTWLPEYRMGMATEADVAEAFRPLVILKRAFWSLYALLIASSVAIFVFTIIVGRLRREAQRAVIEAQQLGQYTLESKLGAGAMGVVYRGHHAMMRRPTAIKMLDVDEINESSIQRFEREVQLTCQLNHPNTIAIYDYGRTPEGLFYYAMEYLEGIDLETLVDRDGPQTEGRVIHILRQICGSLYEAHTQGLVHRDVKPANIMLTRRGGQPDFVKVLDFGLVKSVEETGGAGNGGEALSGTPLYMSPEAFQSPLSVDARSDLYAVGAVGYFLLTGHPVFQASGISELCRRHIDDRPEPPSERLGRVISTELEDVLYACLEKNRARRPQTARDLQLLLEKCPAAGTWTTEDAEAWWSRYLRGPSAQSAPTSQNGTGEDEAAQEDTSELEQTMVLDPPEQSEDRES